MLNDLITKLLGSALVSKRLFAFLINKLTIIGLPFLAKYGFNVQIDEKALYACLAALVANVGAYVWAETHRPSASPTAVKK